jgi:hypothetical protein
MFFMDGTQKNEIVEGKLLHTQPLLLLYLWDKKKLVTNNKKLLDSYISHSGCPNYQITAIVFLFSDRFGKGEVLLEVDSTWLIHYKNTDGSGSLGGPHAKRGKTTRVYLERGKQNKMCAFVNMWMTISCSGYTIIHTEVAPGFRKELTNDFHRTLDDVWQLFCYGVWSTGPRTYS